MDKVTLIKRKVTESQWAEQIVACRNSGLSVSAWCRENGVRPKTYYYHLRKLREKVCEQIPVAITVLPERSELSGRSVALSERSEQSGRSVALSERSELSGRSVALPEQSDLSGQSTELTKYFKLSDRSDAIPSNTAITAITVRDSSGLTVGISDGTSPETIAAVIRALKC